MHSQATAYAKLAESAALNLGLTKSSEAIDELTDESGLMVLPVSAESTGLLPDCKGNNLLLGTTPRVCILECCFLHVKFCYLLVLV